jgi:hypothetical protein
MVVVVVVVVMVMITESKEKNFVGGQIIWYWTSFEAFTL